ncbi:MAG: 2-C-methyl-D-erythritol 2,4-cyclodiphosphate synthase [Victivallales bacterium]|nr:2-C-methyl-D-erythritol 2,4-cyclodiphosphate synthase [Victivallales bacterium]
MMRIGQGYDIHRFTAGRPLFLGGFEIPMAPKGLKGHSDADALVHAIIDAILGALALGDIGQWFPDSSSEWQGASGRRLIQEILRDERVRSWRIVNLDCTVITQSPKLSPHIINIRKSLAELLNVDVNGISVKAKTKEGLDAVGAGEALEAQAVILMEHL